MKMARIVSMKREMSSVSGIFPVDHYLYQQIAASASFHLQNDLYCVRWGVTHSLTANIITNTARLL